MFSIRGFEPKRRDSSPFSNLENTKYVSAFFLFELSVTLICRSIFGRYDNMSNLNNLSDSANHSKMVLPDDIRLLTYEEVAEILGVSKKTVENICRVRKEVPIIYVGHLPRIRMVDLKAYIVAGGSQHIEEKTQKKKRN